MKDKTLVILAAGMGSRFGGLKQTEKFGPSGEFIIDYSIYDAIKAGFNKVVFIIKEENYDLFRETVGSRVESHINVEYVFQNFDNVPSKYTIPEERIKPLGTAHAILCAKDAIHENFCIINSDDFYGYDAFRVASEYMDNIEYDIAIVGYKVVNTLTENGSVKRGILRVKDGCLDKIIESKIEYVDGKLCAEDIMTAEKVDVSEDDLVSMNMIVFPKDFTSFIEAKFENFLDNANLLKDEYLIPDVVSASIKEGRNNVLIKKTESKWVGVTYKEDTPSVKEYILELVNQGVYKKDLWS